MKKYLLILMFVPALLLIFVYTKASISSFLFGFSLCLFAEIFILVFYFFLKIQRAYRDTKNFNLSYYDEKDHQVPTDFNIPIDQQTKKNHNVFLNKFTEEQRVLNKKKSLTQKKITKFSSEDVLINEEARTQTQNYLKEIKVICKILNQFNNILVDFGSKITSIDNSSIFNRSRYFFSKFEETYESEINLNEIQDEDRRVINQLKHQIEFEIKLKQKKDTQNFTLPTWEHFMIGLKFIGKSFMKLEDIRQSNSEVLEMIHRKMQEDYQFLEKNVKELARNIQEIQDKLENLRNQQEKLQKYQASPQNQTNVEIIYWLKKQYFQFTGLQLGIKQNQKKYKMQTQKFKYFKQKLGTFCSQQRRKYERILQTRYYAFLDSYFITINESIVKIRELFVLQSYYIVEGPPKVKKMVQSKNMNQTLAAELAYQEEYFSRVEYYLNKLKGILRCMSHLDEFLNNLKETFQEMQNNLKMSSNQYFKELKYFTKFFYLLSEQSKSISNKILQLQEANQKLRRWNCPQLIKMKDLIENALQKSRVNLSKININEGPIQHKYKLIKSQLSSDYKDLEVFIQCIQQFQKIYTTHTNRIKKIVIFSWLSFLNNQKKYIHFGDVLTKAQNNEVFSTGFDQDKFQVMMNQLKVDVTEDEVDKIDNLDSGYFFTDQYKSLLNRFLFVAYTEWKDSQFFKYTLSREVYILLNQDPNDYLSEIKIQDFNIEGFPPEVIWVKELKYEDCQFLADLNIAFCGKITLKISTVLLTLIPIPLEITINIEEFYAVLRLCFVNSEKGRSWFSFIGDPIAKFVVTPPKFGNYQIVVNLLQNLLLKKLRRSVYPIRQKISIPLSKEDFNYEIIQQRFNSMRK